MKKTTAKTITSVILVIFLLCISLQSVTVYAFPSHSIEKNATRNNNTNNDLLLYLFRIRNIWCLKDLYHRLF